MDRSRRRPIRHLITAVAISKSDDMGGSGSGFEGAKRTTVEEALVLSASAFVRKKALVPGAWTRGTGSWTYQGADNPHATIG